MQAQLIAVDAAALTELMKKVDRLETLITEANITPREKWLSIKDAAQVLKCDPSTVRRKIASGELKAQGSGKARRVLLD